MNKIKITIGDWSQDGHNQSDEFAYNVNKSIPEMVAAYRASCQLTGLIFDCNENHTGIPGLDWQNPETEDRQIFVEYQQNELSDLAQDILAQHQLTLAPSPESMAEFMLKFIQLTLPDLTFEEASAKRSELKDLPVLNGWWSKSCNESWGYGLYE